jgi:hypothetical protein
MGITCSDVLKMGLTEDCAVLSFTNVKLKRKPRVWRGFPKWYGILLRLYLQEIRVSVPDSDLLFVDPLSRKPLGKRFRLVGTYLRREYRLFRGYACENYIGGNLKRKIFSTVIDYGTHRENLQQALRSERFRPRS